MPWQKDSNFNHVNQKKGNSVSAYFFFCKHFVVFDPAYSASAQTLPRSPKGLKWTRSGVGVTSPHSLLAFVILCRWENMTVKGKNGFSCKDLCHFPHAWKLCCIHGLLKLAENFLPFHHNRILSMWMSTVEGKLATSVSWKLAKLKCVRLQL